MAYFANGSEGHCFDEQCSNCKYGEHACPIALAQASYNYDQLKDTTGTARKILDLLVKKDGTCTFYEMAKKDLFKDKNQLKLL